MVADVADGEPAARTEFAHVQPLADERRKIRENRVYGDGVRLQLEYRRPQMEVQPNQVEVGRGERPAYRGRGVARLYREAELAVENPRGGGGVGVRVDARRETEQNILRRAAPFGDFVQQRQLVETVDDHAPAADVHRVLQLVGRLVVAVKIDAVHIRPGGMRDRQLAARHDVQPQPFLRHEARDCGVDERFGGVQDAAVGIARGEGVREAATHAAQSGVVEDEQRRAELARQLDRIAAADGQPVLGADAGGEREEGSVVERHGTEVSGRLSACGLFGCGFRGQP